MSFFEIDGLNVSYKNAGRPIAAVRDCGFSIEQGDSLGIVGESGSGKSTLALALLRLLSPGVAEVSGRIVFDGSELLGMSEPEFNSRRWVDLSMVFQKSMTSFSPVHKIGKQLRNIYRVHRPHEKADVIERAMLEIFQVCNLDPKVYHMYPFELSGGMLQRVSIAMALMHKPKLLILDEATTALDVITQQQIMAELKDIQSRYHLTLLVISHDLSVITKLCNKVAVMYSGSILEFGNRDTFILSPRHPYTKALVASYPKSDLPKGALHGIPGNLPDMGAPPRGCIFAGRCPYCQSICRTNEPPEELLDGMHRIRCHRWREL